MAADNRPGRVALLCVQWGLGYGVPTVVAKQAMALVEAGWAVDVFCRHRSGEGWPLPRGVRVRKIPGRPGAWALAAIGDYDVAISHTAPFHEFVAASRVPLRIAWNHGEPPAEWFPGQEASRRATRARDLGAFAEMDAVVSISRFVQADSGEGSSRVLYNGADQLWDANPLPAKRSEGPLKVVCVARLGPGERLYKGLEDAAWLAASARGRIEVTVVGKGTAEDAEAVRSDGLSVERNVSNHRLAELYAGSDALVSFSRWEGFNLPLVECGFFGLPGIALDRGGHPEVTPWCFPDRQAVLEHLLSRGKDGLLADSSAARSNAARFTWNAHGRALLDLLAEKAEPGRGRALVPSLTRLFWDGAFAASALGRSLGSPVDSRRPDRGGCGRG